ncbi:carbonate dehydratase [Pseudomonas fluorescens HK44]|uniref:Carbonate dehydratase n=1 Tax=Pseudomonas fluorescens HK44 TaxID=1042209 RepID=A0A010RGA0_PSEFL|nr:carbonate dehydratase [Pseudomonas fluorescens]EXF91751.1 carbonate dehydratase [Pseudomonas fluorescens HK44]
MIRMNPSGDLPRIAESAYVDKTAIICGKVVIGENVFVGPYAVIRADEVDDSGKLEPITIGAKTDLSQFPSISVSASEFSEDVARTNVDLVRDYKALQNEF